MTTQTPVRPTVSTRTKRTAVASVLSLRPANAAATPAVTPSLDDGAIRLTVHTPGSARLVVLFVRALSQHPQVRFARMEGGVHGTPIDLLLSLTAPLPLAALLQEMPGVRRVRHMPPPKAGAALRKASPGSPASHLEVVLAHAGAAMQAAA